MISLRNIFKPYSISDGEPGAYHFVNHHSFVSLIDKGCSFPQKGHFYFVDGTFLHLFLTVLRVPHSYIRGGKYLSYKLKDSTRDKFVFISPNEMVSELLSMRGYKTYNVPLLSNENIPNVCEALFRDFGFQKSFVTGIGSPNQDILAEYLLEINPSIQILCVGAAVEFLVGTQKAPPKIVVLAKIEWLWRLITNFKVTFPRISLSTLKLFRFYLLGRIRS